MFLCSFSWHSGGFDFKQEVGAADVANGRYPRPVKGADVNATKENGETPLHRAAAGSHKTVVGLLLARGLM